MMKTQNKTMGRATRGTGALLALLILVSMIAVLAAPPFKGTHVLAAKVSAVPRATPPDQPLSAPAATEFIQLLTDETENGLDDFLDLDGVNSTKANIVSKFNGRGALTGKSPRQIADLLFGDVRTVVTDKDVLDSIWANYSAVVDGSGAAEASATPVPVDGTNVTEVEYGNNGQSAGTYRQAAGKTWNSLNAASQVTTTCNETGRDDWSVYLQCADQSTIMMNLWKKEVTRTPKNGASSLAGMIIRSGNSAVAVPTAGQTGGTATNPNPTPPVANGPSPQAVNCGAGFVKGNDGTCVVEVKYYHQDNITPANARAMAARNNWAIATRQQVTDAFNKAGFEAFAYAQIDTGDMCVAVQKDVNTFKRGTNCGLNGGNQGFLYVSKDALRQQAASQYSSIDDYIRSLRYDRDLLLAVEPDAGPPKPLGPPSETPSDDGSVVCTNQRMKFGKNFDALQSLQPNTGIIYPGAALYADNRLAAGTPGSITLKRAPSRLTITNVSAPVDPIVVNDPDSQKVNGAIATALQNFFRSNPRASSTGQSGFSYFEAYSKDQLALNLDFKAEWLSGSAGAIFNFNTSSEKTVLFVVAKEVFYTVDAVLPRTPGAYFDPSVSVADAVNTFDSSRPPAFVQSVDYGRMILFRLETNNSITAADLRAAFAQKAGDNSVDVKAGFDYEKVRRQTDIKYIQLGGGIGSNDVVPTTFDQLKPVIDRGRTLSPSNPGAPLKYTIKFLDFDGYNTARMGDSTEYTERSCKVVPRLSFKVQHRGAYITEVKVTYIDRNGRLVVHPNSGTGRTAGLDDLFNIPGDAKKDKVHLFIRMDTGVGLVTLFDNYLTGEQMDDMCFTTVGTTIIGRDLIIQPCDPNKRTPQP